MKLATNDLSTYRSEIMGLACLYVIFTHNFFNWPDRLISLRRFANCGNIAVEIFLILSGIGMFYSFQRNSALGDYYKRRIVRILVPYLLIAVPFYLWRNAVGEGVFWKDILNISLFEMGSKYTWYPVLALLCYLIFPAVYHLQNHPISVLNRKADNDILTLLCCVLWFILLFAFDKLAPESFMHSEIVWTRLPIFIIGCRLGSIVYDNKELPKGSVAASVFLIAVYLYQFRSQITLSAFWIRMSYVPMSFAFLIVFTAVAKIAAGTAAGTVLRFLGNRSFEIYLVHIMLIYLWRYYVRPEVFDRFEIISFALIIAVSVGVCSILHILVSAISSLLLKHRSKT